MIDPSSNIATARRFSAASQDLAAKNKRVPAVTAIISLGLGSRETLVFAAVRSFIVAFGFAL